MQIIPSFDLLDGKLVRLRQGDFEQKTEYDASPLELAQELEAAGIRRLHMVDLDGARTGRLESSTGGGSLHRQHDDASRRTERGRPPMAQ